MLDKLIRQFNQAQKLGIVSDITHHVGCNHDFATTFTTVKFPHQMKPSVVDAMFSYLHEHYELHKDIFELTQTCSLSSGERQIHFYSNWKDED